MIAESECIVLSVNVNHTRNGGLREHSTIINDFSCCLKYKVNISQNEGKWAAQRIMRDSMVMNYAMIKLCKRNKIRWWTKSRFCRKIVHNKKKFKSLLIDLQSFLVSIVEWHFLKHFKAKKKHFNWKWWKIFWFYSCSDPIATNHLQSTAIWLRISLQIIDSVQLLVEHTDQ